MRAGSIPTNLNQIDSPVPVVGVSTTRSQRELPLDTTRRPSHGASAFKLPRSIPVWPLLQGCTYGIRPHRRGFFILGVPWFGLGVPWLGSVKPLY